MLNEYINEINKHARSQLTAIAAYGSDELISELVSYAIAQSKLRPSTGYAEIINAAVTQMARDAIQQDGWLAAQYEDDQFFIDLPTTAESAWLDFETTEHPLNIPEELRS